MAEEKIRRGFLAKYSNYRDWFMSQSDEWQQAHMPHCARCGREFIPDAPNQKYCSDECFKRTHEPSIYNGSWAVKMNKTFLTPVKKKQ